MLKDFYSNSPKSRGAATVRRIASRTRVGVAVVGLSFASLSIAQDIEPRRWTPLPLGMNIFGAAHARGGESTINGVKKDDERQDRLYGISAGLPIGSRSSAKLAYVGSRTSEGVGKDTDSVALADSIRF